MATTVRLSGDGLGYLRLVVYGGDFQANLASIRSIPGRRWMPDQKAWMVPETPEALRSVFRLWGEKNTVLEGAAQRLLPAVREAETALQAKREDADPDPLPNAKTPPWRHQARAFWFAKRHSAVMLNMGMGTGKSKVVVDLVNHDPTLNRVLILCPKSVVGVWPRQFALHGSTGAQVIAMNGKGTTEQKRSEAARAIAHAAAHNPVVLVFNYEAARYGFKTPECKQKRIDAEPGSLAEWILTQSWDLVVLDESHRIKDPTGKIGSFCSRLRGRASKRVCLTGTPMPHSPLDVFSQFRFLDPGIFGTSWVAFRAQYAIMGGYLQKQVLGFRDQDQLAERMDQITFSAKTDDVLDLPPFTDDLRTFALSHAERKIYDKLESDFVAEVGAGAITASNALVKLLRLQQVACGFATLDKVDGEDDQEVSRIGTSRREVLEDVLEDVGASEPVVVFCRFIHDLDVVKELTKELGREYRELSGRRNDLRDGVWQDGDVIAVQIQAGGVGVDLTRARYCVYYSIGFSLGDYEQSRARVRRPGQTRPVTYFHLQATDTVDGKVFKALSDKRDVVQYILDQV